MKTKQITVKDYQEFIEKTNHKEPLDWSKQLQFPNWPVLGISANDADDYCNWSGLRLPTEEEWLSIYKDLGPIMWWEVTSTVEQNLRVLRGGSFLNVARFLRAAVRVRYEPEYHYDNIGFRCVENL